jgi:hypothetical protein
MIRFETGNENTKNNIPFWINTIKSSICHYNVVLLPKDYPCSESLKRC